MSSLNGRTGGALMATIRISRDVTTGDALIGFRYDADVVELLKTFPAWARRWNPATREWVLFESFVPELTAMLRGDGHRVINTYGRTKTAPPPPRRAPHGDSWADALLDAVGPERVEPVHRALTRVLHPDTDTGDTALMQQLNVARDRRTITRTAA